MKKTFDYVQQLRTGNSNQHEAARFIERLAKELVDSHNRLKTLLNVVDATLAKNDPNVMEDWTALSRAWQAADREDKQQEERL